jgi:tetratricopeptide (TPR) repeat protein
VRSSTRHHLKEDQFAHAAAETMHWASGHRKSLVFVISGAVIVLSLVLGGWFYQQRRESTASLEMAKALRSYHAPIRAVDEPEVEGQKSFTSAKERYTTAQKEFQAIADNYSHTRSAEIARYYIGLTAAALGDTAKAEQELSSIASSRDRDLSALAKYALANFYRGQGKPAEAIKLYKELVADASRTVPKHAAQFELASMYEQSAPDEAVKIYNEMKAEAPQSVAAKIATERLSGASR